MWGEWGGEDWKGKGTPRSDVLKKSLVQIRKSLLRHYISGKRSNWINYLYKHTFSHWNVMESRTKIRLIKLEMEHDTSAGKTNYYTWLIRVIYKSTRTQLDLDALKTCWASSNWITTIVYCYTLHVRSLPPPPPSSPSQFLEMVIPVCRITNDGCGR
jgi:hypothetical protein